MCQDPANPDRVRLWAISTTDLYLSEDGGATWDQLTAGGIDFRELWALAVHPTRPNELYVGTMPAALYVSENGGRSFRELASFRALPDYARWTFPPAPHTAHIRHIVLDARLPDDILIGVEEGGVARSRDRGVTWEDASGPPSDTAFPAEKDLAGGGRYAAADYEDGRVYRDVHQVLRHPTRPEILYATTGRGTYRSADGGQSWDHLTDGLPVAYSLLVAAHPAQPDRLFVGAAGNGPPGLEGLAPSARRPMPPAATAWTSLKSSAAPKRSSSAPTTRAITGARWPWPARRAPVRHLLAAGPSRQSQRAVRRLRRRQRLRQR